MNWLTRGASAGDQQQQQQHQQQHQYRLFAVEFTSRKSVEIPSQVRVAQASAALPESPEFFPISAILLALRIGFILCFVLQNAMRHDLGILIYP